MELNFNTFLEKYNLTQDQLSFLGEGANGEASSFEYDGNTYVLKYSNSEDEYNIAKNIKEKQTIYKGQESIYDHAVMIFDIGEFISSSEDNMNLYDYFIIMEHLMIDDNLSYLFSDYFEAKYGNNEDEFKSNYPEEFDAFRNLERIQENVGSNDLHAENIGYSNNGIIKGFDWDRR